MEYTTLPFFLFISNNLEFICTESHFNKTFNILGLKKNKTFTIGTTFIDFLNSFDNIVEVLNKCIDYSNKPFYRIQDYLRKTTIINKNILEIIYNELDFFYSQGIKKIHNSQSNLKIYEEHLKELQSALKDDDMYEKYYNELIEEQKKYIKNNYSFELDEEDKKQLSYELDYLKKLQTEKESNKLTKKSIIDSIELTQIDIQNELENQKYRSFDELPDLQKEHIKKLIGTIQQYKNYFDLSCGIIDETFYEKYNLDYFKILFPSEFELPKSYLYKTFEKNNTIFALQNLILELSKENKEKNINILKKHVLDIINNNNNNIINCEIFEIHSLQELLNIYMSLFIQKRITINKCKNCGKYFIPKNRSDDVYCDNISPQNPKKTCKEYGAKKTYRDKIKSRPLKDEHYKTSQFFRMRIQRNKGKNNIQEVEKLEKLFNKYKTNYEKKLKQYNNKKLSEEDFINWIIEQKRI